MEPPSNTNNPPTQSVPYVNYPPYYYSYAPQAFTMQQNIPVNIAGERSWLIIGFGITLIVFSLIAIILTILDFSIIGGPMYFHVFAFAANVLFLTKGMLSIAGGCNLRTREQINIISIIVGAVAFFLIAVLIISGPIYFVDSSYYGNQSKGLPVPVYIFTIVNAIFGLILSISTCTQICACCGCNRKPNVINRGAVLIQQPLNVMP